jgi:hypothetical protein
MRVWKGERGREGREKRCGEKGKERINKRYL